MAKRKKLTNTHDVDVKLDELQDKLIRIVHQIEIYRKLRKRIVKRIVTGGNTASPHPATKEQGTKVLFKRVVDHGDLNDTLDDLRGQIGSGNSGAGFGA